MCGCANRLRVFMQQNGFTQTGHIWSHPNGYRYSEHEVVSGHALLMTKLLKYKLLGKLAIKESVNG